MTQKEYDQIADIFAREIKRLDMLLKFKGEVSTYNQGQIDELHTVIGSVMFWFKQNDKTFDKDKFLAASGIKVTEL